MLKRSNHIVLGVKNLKIILYHKSEITKQVNPLTPNYFVNRSFDFPFPNYLVFISLERLPISGYQSHINPRGSR